MKKRLISMLLALVMVLGMIPMTVLADEACAHENTTASYVDNGDRTHNTTVTCDDCGESVAQEAIVIDFKEFAKEAAQQSFWAELPEYPLSDGRVAKRIGGGYGYSFSAAELALKEWMASRDWNFDMSQGDNRIFLCAEDTIAWGIGHYAYFLNMEKRSDLHLNINVEEAGTYVLSLDRVLNAVGSSDCPEDGIAGSGGGYADIYVNGELVYEHMDFADRDTSDGWSSPVTDEIATVNLVKGVNTVALRTVADYNDLSTTMGGRNGQNLKALTLTKLGGAEACIDETGEGNCDLCGAKIGECRHFNVSEVWSEESVDGVHTATAVCDNCGEPAPNSLTVVDFISSMKKASEQSFWANLKNATTANGKALKELGNAYGTNEVDPALSAYKDMNAWLMANEGWCINESVTKVLANSGNRVYITADDTMNWGLGQFNNQFIGLADRCSVAIDVAVPGTGNYDLTVDLYNSVVASTDYPNTGMASGGAYADIIVDGEVVLEDVPFNGTGSDPVVLEDLYLTEGVHTITFQTTLNFSGTASATGRCGIYLQALELTQTSATKECKDLDADGDGFCDECGELSGPCKHINVEKVWQDETVGGPHTATAVCAYCGEAAPCSVTMIDFRAAMQAASKQDFWAGLADQTTANGKALKELGHGYNVAIAESEVAAYNAMNAWLKATYGWNINEAQTGLMQREGNRVYVSADDTLGWALAQFNNQFMDFSDRRTNLAIDTAVAGTGYYDITVDISTSVVANTDYPNGMASGGGYADIWIDGEVVAENVPFNGTGTDPVVLENVYLTAGAHTITFHASMNFSGTASATGRCGIYLNSIEFAQKNAVATCAEADEDGDGFCDACGGLSGNCKHVNVSDEVKADELPGYHTIVSVCDACGEEVARSTTSIDYKAFVKEAAKQPFWNKLTSVYTEGGVEVKRLGVAYGQELTELEEEGHEEMKAWMEENGWSIDLNQWSNRIYLAADDRVEWAICDNAYFYNYETYSNFAVTINVEEAGQYKLSMDFIRQAVGASDVVADAAIASGGGYGDIYVNGVRVFEHFDFADRNTSDGYTSAVTGDFGTVTLNAGKNVIAVRTVSNYNDVDGYSGRANICINALHLEQISATPYCADADTDGVCDVCGDDYVCAHAQTKTFYEDNEDGTHTKMTACEICTEFISTEVIECADGNEDGICDACEAELSTECTHADEDKDTYCDDCGEQIVVIEKLTVVGANMTLGNDLKMNFMVKKSDMKDGYVAYVTQGDLEPVELELWSYNASYYAASYSVAAKEMTDVLSIEIYDADGYLVSNPFTRTIRQYAMTLLNNASQTAKLKAVIVDMLNYGTEAQKYFKYNTEDLANAEVTAEQQAQFATGDVECKNIQDKVLNCAGSNLSLEDSILLNVFFSGVSGKDIAAMSATIEFVDYKGNAVSATVGAEKYGSAMAKVVVNQVVLADAKRPVTVKLFDADGTKIGEAIESVESYIARNLTNASTGAINMAIIKFATSAYNYLGGTN